jgi:hypothetical protein
MHTEQEGSLLGFFVWRTLKKNTLVRAQNRDYKSVGWSNQCSGSGTDTFFKIKDQDPALDPDRDLGAAYRQVTIRIYFDILQY